MENRILHISYKEHDLEVSVNMKQHSDEWILCLHGLQSNKWMFEALLRETIFDNYSKLSIDYIGFWKSSKSEIFSYNLEDQKDICIQVLKQLNIMKIHIIGHSMWWMIGIMMLDEFEGEILSFVNMEGNLTLDDCWKSAEVINSTFDDFSNFFYPKLKNSIKFTPREKWVWMIPDYVFYKTSKSIVDWSKTEKLLKLFNQSNHRKLFIYGDKNSNKTRVLNNTVEFSKISNAGHFMLIDNYDETITCISNFIR